ncbi:hypothetical protein [Nocardia fluminea]|uniref:hypothetical protein n=1 Tax=Nocardia fluminea TaxID=134984 RepID=UPI00341CBA81
MAARRLDKFAWMEALRGADLTHAEYRVAANLWTYARADLTNARPGPVTLREAARVNEKTLKKALSALVAKGWIRITEQGGSEPGGTRRATVYALTFPTGGSEYPGSNTETGGSEYPGSAVPTGGSEFHDRGYSVPRPGVVSTADRGYSLPPHQGSDQGRTGEDHSPGRVGDESAASPVAAADIQTPPNQPQPTEPAPPTTPASRYCPRHPQGTPDRCTPCREHREAFEAAELEAEAIRRAQGRARAAVLTECPHCDQNGYRVEPDRFYAITLAAARCDHTAWTEVDWDDYVSTESSEARQAAARAQPWAFG